MMLHCRAGGVLSVTPAKGSSLRPPDRPLCSHAVTLPEDGPLTLTVFPLIRCGETSVFSS